jgi:hypothetical protein
VQGRGQALGGRVLRGDVQRRVRRAPVVPVGVDVDVKMNPKMSDLERDAAQTSRS